MEPLYYFFSTKALIHIFCRFVQDTLINIVYNRHIIDKNGVEKMRLISTDRCQEGMTIGKSIFNEAGKVLIQEGVQLSPRMIERLLDLHISKVYIQDQKTEGIVAESILSDQTKQMALKTIHDNFNIIVKSNPKNMVISSGEMSKSFRQTVKAILSDIKGHKKAISVLTDVCSHDQYTFQHSLNVTIYTLAIASKYSFTEQQLIEIGLGAILHDVGKIMVPYNILAKPDSLNDEEFEMIKKHPIDGFNILRKMEGIPLLCAHCAYQHHERLNGSGYPRGIGEKDIHLYAKIIGIADVFDALTSDRSYRKAMLPHLAMELIYSGAGTLFDYDLVTLFRNTISIYPIGITVKLSNGMTGVVVDQNNQLPSRPIIRILTDETGQEVSELRELDLANQLSVVIEECDI